MLGSSTFSRYIAPGLHVGTHCVAHTTGFIPAKGLISWLCTEAGSNAWVLRGTAVPADMMADQCY